MCDRLRQCPGSKRGPLTGPNPTDRGKNGSKIHLITDRNGLPLSLGISGANMHDSLGLEPLVRGIPPIRSRRGPRRRRPAKLHGDKGYDYDHLRRWLRKRGIRHRIARKGIESSQRLGRHRWVVERTVSWLAALPPPAPSLRTQGRALPRLRRNSRSPHLPPPSGQMIRSDRLGVVSGQHEDYAIACGGDGGEEPGQFLVAVPQSVQVRGDSVSDSGRR